MRKYTAEQIREASDICMYEGLAVEADMLRTYAATLEQQYTPMTDDKSRAAFQLAWIAMVRDPQSIRYNNPLGLPADGDAEGWARWGWQAAFRYRNEQEKQA